MTSSCWRNNVDSPLSNPEKVPHLHRRCTVWFRDISVCVVQWSVIASTNYLDALATMRPVHSPLSNTAKGWEHERMLVRRKCFAIVILTLAFAAGISYAIVPGVAHAQSTTQVTTVNRQTLIARLLAQVAILQQKIVALAGVSSSNTSVINPQPPYVWKSST